ncbi:dTDP-4-amino-4,6-dideoxygalactose transaminase [Butyrivibrio sp. ob235]|uniref:DegT/DnrJ/EryC1/StrS family aminotransferase n=1 Tax=Butyrivibrio sp. ob235 TaxID=1761780 RepID=UPI0008B909AF|nr:DegT/DnrJ/EryC1/StrS family aminotransferase [Butyrivibrio sp. ob235]SEL73602.1 dTDP-4-amino-4,6-dideoxygalactose transaminase [Butyrivibrio sp. ob235]
MSIGKFVDNRKGIFVTKPSLPPFDEYVEYLREIWDRGILTNMGPLHEKFRENLSEFLGVDICLPSCNGHMGLELTIQAFELQGEIITTPYTFASTTHAIVRNRCTPVFCDVREEDCTIDTEKIEELISDKTVAIVPVHVYGLPCNVDEIERIATKHGLRVIYDAAHAFGVKIGERGIASYGDASMFSFHATKAFHTIEGGCVALRDVKKAMRLYQLENFGIMGEEQVSFTGANAKMNEFEAAMGLCNLLHFSENIEKRKRVYERYESRFADLDGVRMPSPYRDDITRNYSYLPIFIDKDVCGMSRDDVYAYLALNNIYSRKYFYPLTSQFDCYRDKGYRGDTPIAERLSEQVLTLPIYADLELEKVDHICDMIINFLK